jgi:hypothetical protein
MDYVDINDSVDISGTTTKCCGCSTLKSYSFWYFYSCYSILMCWRTIEVSNVDTKSDLNVSGISTLGTVKISSGIVTASSGIVTYYGDGNI